MLKDQTMAIRQFSLDGCDCPSEEAKEAELPQKCIQNNVTMKVITFNCYFNHLFTYR